MKAIAARDDAELQQELFAAWLRTSSPHTQRAREADLRALAWWCSSGTSRDPESCALWLVGLEPHQSAMLVSTWTAAQLSAKVRVSTVARRVSSISSWYAAAAAHGLCSPRRLPRPPVAAYSRRGCPERSQIDEALRELVAGSRHRELAALLLLADCGLRVAELCALRVTDLSLSGALTARIVRKGGREVVRTISSRAAAALRQAIGDRRDGPAIVSPSGRAWRPEAMRRWVRMLGLGTPHALRHAGATDLYRRTHDAELVRQWLGHAHLSTTQHYVHALDDAAGVATQILAGEREVEK